MIIILCPQCKGNGEHMKNLTDYSLHPADRISRYDTVKCDRCEGSGRLIKEIKYLPYRREI